MFTSLVNALSDYGKRIRDFSPNARLYLFFVVISGAGMGIYYLLFNFYALSLGFDEAILGRLITVGNFTALIVALPAGYLADLIGRKSSLVLSAAVLGISVIGMVLWPREALFYVFNVLIGISQSLAMVTMAPFLMENSGETERVYLFSFGQGLGMASAFVGNWVGGYLPTWVGRMRSVTETSREAYGSSLVVVAVVFALSVMPLLFLRRKRLPREDRSVFAPLNFAKKKPVLLVKLISPLLITSIGAGLIMPFMNVFFRNVHAQPDPVIGSLFAWGSLAMGIGLLIAPPLAERFGKIQLVVVTQAISIPFLILLGFAPIFWLSAVAYYIRLTFMNMNAPIYETYVMERVESSARATVASLAAMSWSFGWTISPMVSGWLQVRYGFVPPFIGTIILYTIAVFMYWAFFWFPQKQVSPSKVGD